MKLSIEIKADDINNVLDLRWIMEELTRRIERGETENYILDINRNRIGTFKVKR